MRLPTRYLDIFSVLVLTGLLTGGMGLMFMHFKTENNKIQLHAQLINQQKNDLDLTQTNIKTLKKTLADYQTFLAHLGQRIPATSGIGHFLSTLDQIAGHHGVKMLKVAHDPPEKTNRYHQVMVHMVFKGSFKNIYTLIHALETLNRLVIIDTIQLTRQDGTAVCTAQVSAIIFYE